MENSFLQWKGGNPDLLLILILESASNKAFTQILVLYYLFYINFLLKHYVVIDIKNSLNTALFWYFTFLIKQ